MINENSIIIQVEFGVWWNAWNICKNANISVMLGATVIVFFVKTTLCWT